MGKFGKFAGDLGMQAAQGALGGVLGLVLGGVNDRRQLKQQEKLQALEIEGQKQMTDYNQKKQMEMWEATGYDAQKDQMKKAGLNPGLMYGMGGGGGQTVNVATGNVSGADAPKGGGESMGMAMMMGQMGLLRAQKENIEADTELKKESASNQTAQAQKTGMENALTAWLQNSDEYGNDVGENIGNGVRGQTEIEGLRKIRMEMKTMFDKNERELVLNNANIQKLGEDINLLKKKGLTEDQILENLKKEGKLKDAEIAWNALDLEPGNWGKFLTNLIKLAFK